MTKPDKKSSKVLNSEEEGAYFGFHPTPLSSSRRCASLQPVISRPPQDQMNSCYSPPPPPLRHYARGGAGGDVVVDGKSTRTTGPPALTDTALFEINAGRSILDRPLSLSEISPSRQALYEEFKCDDDEPQRSVRPRLENGGLMLVSPSPYPSFSPPSLFSILSGDSEEVEEDMPRMAAPIRLPVRISHGRSPPIALRPRMIGRFPAPTFAPIQPCDDD